VHYIGPGYLPAKFSQACKTKTAGGNFEALFDTHHLYPVHLNPGGFWPGAQGKDAALYPVGIRVQADLSNNFLEATLGVGKESTVDMQYVHLRFCAPPLLNWLGE
jgi:hypothetical protein